MSATEQARVLFHWTAKYEHAKHMLHRLKEMLEFYRRQLNLTRNSLRKARINILEAKCRIHAAKWVKVRNISLARIRYHFRRYHQELTK
jgi:hypothetical protein